MVGVKSAGNHAFYKVKFFVANSTNFYEVLSFKPALCYRIFSLFYPEVIIHLNFIQFNCQVCYDLRAFLGVQFGLKDLICVKNFTFCNSAGVLICEVHFQWTVLKILAVKYIRFLLRNIFNLKCS